jgi:predicted RNA methylase
LKLAFGKLNDEQAALLKPFVAGKVVYDLGAGHLGMAQDIVRLGAKRVVAVDQIYKDPGENCWNECKPWEGGENIVLKAMSFYEFIEAKRKPMRTVLVSWPFAHISRMDAELTALVEEARTLIYLGCNTDGTYCGGPLLFEEFRRRKVLAHSPNKFNSLAVYGAHSTEPRPPLPEELAHASAEVMYYDEALDAALEAAKEAPHERDTRRTA